jgi:gliding motility-associated-like protein
LSAKITALRLIFILPALLFICLINASAQTCTTQQYSKNYTFNGKIGYINSALETPEHKLVFSGSMNSGFALFKTNQDGVTMWSKHFGNSTYLDGQTRTVIDKDSNYVSGFTAGTVPVIFKSDTAGNTILAKAFAKSFGYLNFTDLAVMNNGDKIILLNDGNSYWDGYFLLRCSPDLSSIIWSKFYSEYELKQRKILADGNKIILAGATGITVVNASTGNLIVRKRYTISGYNVSFLDVHRYNDGYLVNSNSAPQSHIVLRLDTNFNLVSAYTLTNTINYQLEIYPEPDGSYYAAHQYATNLFYVDKNDVVVWSKVTGSAATFANPARLLPTDQGLYAIGNANFIYGPGLYGFFNVSKATYSGIIGNCTNYNVTRVPIPSSIVTLSQSLSIIDSSAILISNVTLAENPYSYVESSPCSGTSNCSSLNITGPATLCGNTTVQFTGVRNAGCLLPVQWLIGGGSYNKQQLSDNTVSIQFLLSGSYQLIAKLGTACSQIADTQIVQVTVGASNLNLGPDTSLCTGNTLTLNAHSGFSSYLWQNGTTDSLMQISQPGTYYVSTTDACGLQFADTVHVSQLIPPALNLGLDRTKCNKDTLQLNAPGGFLSYSWSPAYNITSTNSQNTVVNPNTDTSYYLKAESFSGCFSFDTISVTVNHSPAINLGNDSSFCQGNSMMLDAGAGFSSYNWSNGMTIRQIMVNTPGSYSVMAFTQQGCKSFDTLIIQNVWTPPQVTISGNTGICLGGTTTLDAGSYTYPASYSWSNGAYTKTISINTTGTYSVTVTSDHNCKASAFVVVDRVWPLPSGFLPGDTSICSYSTLVIQPGAPFPAYYWNTGSTSGSVTISKPGVYWLQVKDANGCEGKDSILVSGKDCMHGFFIPNAFTPGGDHRNDEFKPLLFGNARKYVFEIYDRWGKIIFRSAVQGRGWDGNVNGKVLGTGVYVWKCIYQFEGEQTKTEKGTVILMR